MRVDAVVETLHSSITTRASVTLRNTSWLRHSSRSRLWKLQCPPVREECLNREQLWTLTKARVVLEDWRWNYNNIRPNRSLGYITPIRFAQKEQEPQPALCQASLRPDMDFLYNLKDTINTPRLTLALAQFG